MGGVVSSPQIHARTLSRALTTNTPRRGSAFGRTFKEIQEKMVQTVHRMSERVLKRLGLVFKGIAGIMQDPYYLGRGVSFVMYSLGMYRFLANCPEFLDNFSERARSIERVIDASYIFDDLDYFGNEGYKKDLPVEKDNKSLQNEEDKRHLSKESRPFVFGKRVVYLMGDLASPIVFLSDLNLVDVGRIVGYLGGKPFVGPIFQGMWHVGGGVLLDGIYTIGRCYALVDAMQTSLFATGRHRRKGARIDALYIALKIAATVAGYFLSPKCFGRVALKFAASLFGIISALYSIYKAEKLEREKVGAFIPY